MNQAAAAGVEAQREFDQQLAQQRLNNEMAIAQARMAKEDEEEPKPGTTPTKSKSKIGDRGI